MWKETLIPVGRCLFKSQEESNPVQLLHDMIGHLSLIKQDPNSKYLDANAGKDNLCAQVTETLRGMLTGK